MLYLSKKKKKLTPLMLWQFFSLPGIENGIEYRYFQGIVSKLEIPVSWQH